MNAYKPRRPAQFKPEQIELIEGGADVAEASELAHTTASVVVPLPTEQRLDPGVRERVQAVIDDDGIDALAETWVAMPPESLPGILWRGYLLREWVRRFPDDAHARVTAARKANLSQESSVAEPVAEPVAEHIAEPAAKPVTKSATITRGTPRPEELIDKPETRIPEVENVRSMWDKVFEGNFTGDFEHVLVSSAVLTHFIGHAHPEWIGSDTHPLATSVTRRQTALILTAHEFKAAAQALAQGLLS